MTAEEIMRADLDAVERILNESRRDILAALNRQEEAIREARAILDKYKTEGRTQ